MQMSNDPNTVLAQFVPGFVANLALSPQQMTSHLLDAVDADMNYSEPGEGFNLDDLGESDPEDVATRVADTPDKFIGSERRVANFTEYHDAAWLDNVDKAKQLVDPANLTMQALMAGRWRKVDDKIMSAALGQAFKKDPATGALSAVSLPAGQIVAANSVAYAHDDETVPAGGADYGLGIGKVIEANALLDESELEGPRFLALSPYDVANLLRQTPVTSQYYTDVQALNSGKVDKLLGFTVKRLASRRFLTSGNNRRLVAWIKSAVAYRGRPVTNARISVRNDKSDTPQAFYKTSHAAGRRYDKGVVEIQAKI